MPTGYTAEIENGISFEKFVWNCARAFGALVELRDDPKSEIPEEFQPSDYYVNSIESRRAEIESLLSMTVQEIQAAAQAEYEEELKRWKQLKIDKLALQHKYEEMLEKVLAWTPPSPDHEGLKSFMVQQIQESVKFDCRDYQSDSPPILPTDWLKWHNKKLEVARDGLAYANHAYAEEVARVKSRNAWVKALRNSVPPQK